MLTAGNRWAAPITLSVLLACFALMLRLYGLTDKPLWLDEIITFERANFPLASLVLDAFRNNHYPTYFILVGSFTSADMNEWMLRFPSAIFGAVSVLFVTLLSAEIGGLRAGLIAGSLMALSPFEVQFGQEARAYTLISCLVLMAICGLVRIVNEPEAAAVSVRRTEALRGAWSAYTFGTAGALLVQNITIPWLLVSNLAMLALVRGTPTARRGLLRNWIWAQIVILSLWLPALVTMLIINQGGLLGGLRWVPEVTWNNIWLIAGSVYLFRVADLMTFMLLPAPFPGFGFGVAMLALLGAWKLRGNRVLLAVIGLAILAMPIAISIVTVFQSVLVPRYLIWSTGPYFILAGVGAASLPTKFFSAISVVAAVGGLVNLAPYYGAETKPRWDQAAAYLADNAHPNDVIIARSPLTLFVFKSYAKRYPLDSNILTFAGDQYDIPRYAAEGKRIWVLYGRVGQATLVPEAEFRQQWSAFVLPTEEIRFGSHILILRYDNATLKAE